MEKRFYWLVSQMFRWLYFFYLLSPRCKKQNESDISSFAAKLSWKTLFCFEKTFLLFSKYTLFVEKSLFLWEKKFYIEKFREFLYRVKYKWKYKKYISFQEYIFIQKMFVLQIKYRSFLKIYSFSKKKKKNDHKKYICEELRCELNNPVFRVSEVANLWYSLSWLLKHKRTSWKLSMGVFILSNAEGRRLGT